VFIFTQRQRNPDVISWKRVRGAFITTVTFKTNHVETLDSIFQKQILA